MRASRLLSTLLLLQNRGRMTAPQLAAELAVSVRTVYRDVEALAAAGVPVYADRGPAGGYQLLDGYRTRLTGMTGDEAESLVLAGLPGPAAELGLGTVLAAAELKLMAALPPDLRDRAGRIRERFHLDAPGWFRESDGVPHLSAAADAVWQQRLLRVRYRRWGPSEVDRDLAPLGLVLKAGTWYLVAQARPGSGVRTYRVSRILDATPTDEPFDRPEGFDLATYWQEYTQRFPDTLYRDEVRVRFSPRALDMLTIRLGATIATEVRQRLEDPDPDGWYEVTVPVESLRHAPGVLLQFGADVEVLGPPELRDWFTTEAAALTRMYGRKQATAEGA